MTLTTRWEHGQVLVVDVAGTFDGDTATQLCLPLTRMLGTGQRAFVVNFDGVEPCGAVAVFMWSRSAMCPAAGKRPARGWARPVPRAGAILLLRRHHIVDGEPDDSGEGLCVEEHDDAGDAEVLRELDALAFSYYVRMLASATKGFDDITDMIVLDSVRWCVPALDEAAQARALRLVQN
ncbi:hypothetical protein OG758_11890 [Streptomyces sp. NBC_01474]|uniref:hypothetical protein n=1 Tax=unclassified Streptomyces TaxID=2593676 RepID=UPI002DDC6CF6|nr:MULTISPECIES: hypothetical protein [unclassified Streptomyces]WSD94776.1 hypothetical protein OG758_11890 [Streptomyces sp. NBC_01474]